MTASNDSKTAADKPASQGTAFYYEQKLHGFWTKNRNTIMAACAAVLLVVAGRGAWDFFRSQHEKDIETEYAAAASPEALRAFAGRHQGTPLAGAASLRLADQEYSNGKYTDALTDYTVAAGALRGTPLDGRAQLGQAVCQIQSGRRADGEAQLKQLAGDLTLLKAVRAEAAYYLASTAADEGRPDDAARFADQVEQIDPQGIWAQRAVAFRASLPSAVGPQAGGLPGGVVFPGAGK